MGDPAGIGPEIIVKALGLEETYKNASHSSSAMQRLWKWLSDNWMPT